MVRPDVQLANQCQGNQPSGLGGGPPGPGGKDEKDKKVPTIDLIYFELIAHHSYLIER